MNKPATTVFKQELDINALRAYMSTQSEMTKVYIGTDSTRRKIAPGRMQAQYATVIVVHIDGCRGCRLFQEVTIEEDVDNNPSKPFNRMFSEAVKTAEMYERLKDVLYNWEVECHLDINESSEHGSNVALSAAKGYIKAMTGCDAIAKPESLAASFAADRVAGGRPY